MAVANEVIGLLGHNFNFMHECRRQCLFLPDCIPVQRISIRNLAEDLCNRIGYNIELIATHFVPKARRTFFAVLMTFKVEETSAKKEAKESNDLKVVMGVVALGPGYWSKLMDAGIRRSMLSYQEQTLLKQVVQLSSTGNIPVSASGKVPYKTMNMIRSVLSIKEKLESEGISVTNGENV